jgi:hypothetical protein
MTTLPQNDFCLFIMDKWVRNLDERAGPGAMSGRILLFASISALIA